MKTLQLAISIACAASAHAAVLSGPVTNAANGHIYYLLTQANWTQSEAEAVTLGGHLVTINDRAENDWVFQTFSTFGGTPRALWIGLTDRQTEGTFVWASGEDSAFTLWSPPQPDNGANGQPPFPAENYVHMLWPGHPTAGHWNDFQDLSSVLGFSYHGVVEVVPPCLPVPFIRVSQIEVCWLSCTNRTYQVQYRSDVTTNTWVDLGASIVGTGTTDCITEPVTSPRRFYRVVLLP